MIKKILIASLLAFNLFLYIPSSFAKKDSNTVIINNEASAKAQNQAVKAPALIPSEAKTLRSAREKQEIRTEDILMKELEKQRLLDEQQRIDKLFGKSVEKTPAVTQIKTQSSEKLDRWFFGKKSFVSFGAGVVSYPGVENINSTASPSYFFSFGGYGYNGYLIFDAAIYYSKHYIKTPHKNYQDVREALDQPAISMAMKFSPLKGKTKPYVGLSGSLVYRHWFVVHKSGESIVNDPNFEKFSKDVADSHWDQSLDAGLAIGADIALGERLGLNLDVRYHFNLYTENREDPVSANLTDVEILDERDSVIFSGSLRYYF